MPRCAGFEPLRRSDARYGGHDGEVLDVPAIPLAFARELGDAALAHENHDDVAPAAGRGTSSAALRPAIRPEMNAQPRWCPWPSRSSPPCPAEPAAYRPRIGVLSPRSTSRRSFTLSPPSVNTT